MCRRMHLLVKCVIVQVSICRTLLDVVHGMAYLHELGLVHG